MTAFDDRGIITESVGFPYEEVEAHLGEVFDPSVATARHRDDLLRVLRTIKQWEAQGVPGNIRGFEIRSAITAWIFLPHWQDLNLTQLAAGFGKDKQSFGRWVDDFKRTFPGFSSPHMIIKTRHHEPRNNQA